MATAPLLYPDSDAPSLGLLASPATARALGPVLAGWRIETSLPPTGIAVVEVAAVSLVQAAEVDGRAAPTILLIGSDDGDVVGGLLAADIRAFVATDRAAEQLPSLLAALSVRSGVAEQPFGYAEGSARAHAVDNLRRAADRAAAVPAPPFACTAADLKAVIRARHAREKFFGSDLFADPAWDMLLDLTVSQLEFRRVSVTSLCVAACVPDTTALRWIKTLVTAGLFARTLDLNDGRRAFIALSDVAEHAMRHWLALHPPPAGA